MALSHDSLNEFISNYERMVKRQDLEDVATSSYLLPIFATLSTSEGRNKQDGGANDGAPQDNPFKGMEEKVGMDTFEMNWREICEQEHPYLSDAQLTMVMSSFLPPPTSPSSSNHQMADGSEAQISFGEFVHAYKVVISTMQSLQLCPRTLPYPSSSLQTPSFRDRIRSRVAVFLHTLSKGEEMNDAKDYLRDMLMDKDYSKNKTYEGMKDESSVPGGDYTDNDTLGTTDDDGTSTFTTPDEEEDGDDVLLAVMMAEKDKQIAGLRARISGLEDDNDVGTVNRGGGWRGWIFMIIVTAFLTCIITTYVLRDGLLVGFINPIVPDAQQNKFSYSGLKPRNPTPLISSRSEGGGRVEGCEKERRRITYLEERVNIAVTHNKGGGKVGRGKGKWKNVMKEVGKGGIKVAVGILGGKIGLKGLGGVLKKL
ncbi:hypothetical protein TrCOL_g2883 [Triparma columacea]|uniref:Uncharacterized protein n=1 Tax=Triparma columacea TaxID=722753 RepID=A0A9W7GDR8_9STRA|nr:hypothetical protein TrCOL_g2883 [Triparma columacea]